MSNNKDIMVEISSNSNSLLAVGFMKKLNSDEMEIKNKTGEALPVLIYNTTIKIKLLLPGESKIMMSGKIHGCKDDTWRVGELTILNKEEMRNSFRQVLNIKSTIRLQNNKTVDCKIVDLSIGGALITTKQPVIPEVFILRIEYKDLKLWTPCIMLRRGRLETGEFQYGCKFKDINERTQDKIANLLFNVQRERTNNL